MLKLPSIHSLWLSFLKVVHRFPLQVLVAVAATIAGCLLVDADKGPEQQLILFLCSCNLALTLLLAGDLYAEVNQLNPVKKWGLRLVAIVICGGLYAVLKPSFYLADVYRIGMLALAFHLLVAFAPYIRKGNVNGFWQYNKSLFLRFLTSALYAGVLFTGLAIALVAIDGLFSVKVGWQIYMRLFTVMTAGFTTIFFLAGIPDDFELLDQDESYPKGLKIFTQYVLIPLMSIYLLILLVYEAKIIINWELPRGLVSTLILGYAVFGILSLLLIHPIKEKEGNGWMKLFSRFFYLMMIPLVVLLLLAVWKRVGNYGVTESRYILVVLAAWLTLITVYFLFSKRQNIKIIPISLCILALLATYGPQSAFSVSEFSQVTRLKKLRAAVNQKDTAEQERIISYLVGRHGLTALQSFTKVDLKALEHTIELKDSRRSSYTAKSSKLDTAFALLKLKRVDSFNQIQAVYFRSFQAVNGAVISVKGYDYVIPVDQYESQTGLKVDQHILQLDKMGGQGIIKLTEGQKTIEFNVSKMARQALAQFKAGKLTDIPDDHAGSFLPAAGLSEVHDLAGLEVRLVLRRLGARADVKDEGSFNNQLSYNGFLLIRIK